MWAWSCTNDRLFDFCITNNPLPSPPQGEGAKRWPPNVKAAQFRVATNLPLGGGGRRPEGGCWRVKTAQAIRIYT